MGEFTKQKDGGSSPSWPASPSHGHLLPSQDGHGQCFCFILFLFLSWKLILLNQIIILNFRKHQDPFLMEKNLILLFLCIKTKMICDQKKEKKGKIWSHHFMGTRWGNSGNSVRLYFLRLPNH